MIEKKKDVFVDKKKKGKERGGRGKTEEGKKRGGKKRKNCTAMINEFDPWKEFQRSTEKVSLFFVPLEFVVSSPCLYSKIKVKTNCCTMNSIKIVKQKQKQ